MNKQIDDGGPAFPRPASEDTVNGTLADGNHAVDSQVGMTLLDWFAGMSLQGIRSRPNDAHFNPAKVAGHAYDDAAAMLAERAKRRGK